MIDYFYFMIDYFYFMIDYFSKINYLLYDILINCSLLVNYNDLNCYYRLF